MPDVEPMDAPRAAPRASAQADAAPVRMLARFEDVIALTEQHRDILMRTALERDVRLVRFEDGRLEIALEAGASRALVNELSRKLQLWTGRPWMIVLSSEHGAAPLKAQAEERKREVVHGIAADPLVQAVMERFPGAQIVGVQVRGEPEQPAFTPPPNDDGDIAPWDDGAPPNDGDDD
jgi:DNA polymerase-3 subunit gamma/tau